MSGLIRSLAIDGAAELILKAESALKSALEEKGGNFPVGFPDTTYFLPVIYSFTGKGVKTLSELSDVLEYAKALVPAHKSGSFRPPCLGDALDAGAAALFACEIIEACKYIIGPDPVCGIFLGAAGDVIMRERGLEFVDGTAPGFAAITGAAPDSKTAVKIARELQQKNLYVFMGGHTNGVQFAEQLEAEGVQLGWETRLVPFGKDVSSLIYALGFANRAALSFGSIKPGDFAGNLKYNKNRIFAFIMALGDVTPEKCAVALGAANYGFPVISELDIPQILPSGICTYEHVVSNVPYDKIVEKALEVRGCKIKIIDVPIPVPYGAAFEGERIRKENTHAEFGGNTKSAFEFVTSVGYDDIADGDIDIIGPDIDETGPGNVLPLGIWVEVAGRKMQTDFEPILERQIHHLVNGAEGIWHMGQRDIVWTRVSKDGFLKGLRLRHYGEIIRARFLSDYPAIVDKVKITMITDENEVEKRLSRARTVYAERDRRLEAMTDESVDTFYSCLLCQSFAPNHVCVITPERLGLCGAYNWLDGKAAYEIDETGANQPLKKGECLDPKKGIWSGINEYVYKNSHKTVKAFSAYSIMDRPMTSCGCFEAIVAYVPECNGVMIVNREFPGDTPVGMSFSTLAGSVGGGQQTPGFIGCGKMFLSSRKFLHAEGGHARIVWMPKELKIKLSEDIKIRFAEQGLGEDFFDKIADEEIATAVCDVRAFMEKISHPALAMDDMSLYSESESESSVSPPASDIRPDTAHTDTSGLAAPVKTEDSVSLSPAHPPSGAMKPPEPEEAPREKTEIKADDIKSFEVLKEKWENKIWTIKLGNTAADGGTRGRTYTVGGSSAMPFHFWEGEYPNPPLVAMEVFDAVSEKYPPLLREYFGDIIYDPAAMAKKCVDEFCADLISVRLDGTHPERGNGTAENAVELVGRVLKAVDVPLIITGHNNFEKNNEVLKAIAQAYEGENLLINWVEQDNYRTIAGAAMAYGHSIVAQSPIDVNIGKQLNILLTNMNISQNRIIMDPMTSAIGYGVEYTYSVMERIRLTGLGGDAMLCAPMIVSVGQECVKIKEFKMAEENSPMWGDLKKRAALWELSTAATLLHAGADILIMYHPDAVREIKTTIKRLMNTEA